MGCLYVYMSASVPGVKGRGWMYVRTWEGECACTYMCVCMWRVSMCEHYCVGEGLCMYACVRVCVFVCMCASVRV